MLQVLISYAFSTVLLTTKSILSPDRLRGSLLVLLPLLHVDLPPVADGRALVDLALLRRGREVRGRQADQAHSVARASVRCQADKTCGWGFRASFNRKLEL